MWHGWKTRLAVCHFSSTKWPLLLSFLSSHLSILDFGWLLRQGYNLQTILGIDVENKCHPSCCWNVDMHPRGGLLEWAVIIIFATIKTREAHNILQEWTKYFGSCLYKKEKLLDCTWCVPHTTCHATKSALIRTALRYLETDSTVPKLLLVLSSLIMLPLHQKRAPLIGEKWFIRKLPPCSVGEYLFFYVVLLNYSRDILLSTPLILLFDTGRHGM
jgi:hypothetical protein